MCSCDAILDTGSSLQQCDRGAGHSTCGLLQGRGQVHQVGDLGTLPKGTPGRTRCAHTGKQRQKQGMSGNKPNSFKPSEATLHILTKKLNKGKELSSPEPYTHIKTTILFTNTAFQITVHRHGVVRGSEENSSIPLTHPIHGHPIPTENQEGTHRNPPVANTPLG